ncbi:MAG: hypothetical protein ACE5H8_10035 [Alphaproteobacteria bacterium]
MTANRAFIGTRGAALAAGIALLFVLGAAAPTFADNPCKSEDPLDFDEANRHADCGDVDNPGWGTGGLDEETARIPDRRDPGYGDDPASDYRNLPTTFSAWYNGLSPSDKRQFTARLVEEAGVGDRRLSAREIEALLTLVSSEIDSYFNSEGLSADQRRKAIAEIAVDSGVGIDRKRGSSADDAIFGRDSNAGDRDSGYNNWERVDPTEDFGDFGRPSGGAPKSDIDLEGF